MQGLRIASDKFEGRGYQEFIVFAKQALRAGKGVAEVAYIRGGGDSDYVSLIELHLGPAAGSGWAVERGSEAAMMERCVGG